MKKLISLFAGALLSTSLLVAPVNAIEARQSFQEQPIYKSCNDVDIKDGAELTKCLGNGHV